MRLTGVRLRNWKRYRGEHEVELSPGVYALVAKAVENPDRSNWLGKSSFVEALWYGITGDVPKEDTVDSVVSHGEAEMAVDLEFDDGTFVVRDRDVKRGKSGFKLTIPDGQGGELELVGDAAQEALEQRIGLTKKDLRATCFVRQKQIAKLVTDDPAEVTGVINGWLDMGKVERAAADLATAAADEERALEQVTMQFRSAQTALGGMESEEELRQEEQRLRAVLEEQQAEAATLARRWEERVAREHERSAWQAAMDRAKRRALAGLELQTAKLALAKHARVTDEQRLAELQQDVEHCLREDAERRQAVEAARPMAAGAFDGVCPVAGIDCPAGKIINGMRREGRARLDAALGAAQAAQETLSHARAAVTPCQAAARRRGELAAQVAALQAVLDRTPDQGDPGVCPPALPVPESTGVDGAVTDQLAEVKARLLRRKELQDVVQAAGAEVLVRGNEVAAYRLARSVLGRRGVQRVIAQRACLVLEQGANERLASAGVDLRITLAWGRETQQLEVTCPSCGLAFPKSARVKQCERCGEARGLKSDEKFHVERSNVSGAADDLAGLALQLAAAHWLRKTRGSPWSVLVLDEPLGALDVHNRRAVAASLTRLVGDGFDQAFVIAHDRGTLDALPQRIEIVADGSWSKVSAT